VLARLIFLKNLTFKYELVEALLYGHGEEPQPGLPHQAQVPYCHGREHPHRNLNNFTLFTKRFEESVPSVRRGTHQTWGAGPATVPTAEYSTTKISSNIPYVKILIQRTRNVSHTNAKLTAALKIRNPDYATKGFTTINDYRRNQTEQGRTQGGCTGCTCIPPPPPVHPPPRQCASPPPQP
jgi:hypothetical protein